MNPINRDQRLSVVTKVVLCILLAVISFFILGRLLSSPETYSGILQSLDSKVQSVLRLTASSTAVSVGITAIPSDIGTPIAEKLADFSEYGILILCVLYAEKYLMTILGSGVFRFILPAVCVLYALSFFRSKSSFRPILEKIAVVSLALYFVIPLSVHVSDLIYNTYQDSIDSTISAAEDLAEDTALLSEAGEDQGAFQRILNALSESTSSLVDRAGEILNRFIESLAIMIVTSCLIPLLVLSFSVWIINQVMGARFPVPRPRRSLRLRGIRPPGFGGGSDDGDDASA
ncbi:MAG: hypothetical protein Q4F32_05265 [Eubacteriales bacterium]|jgi:hypothetical protein|nr:hypothetical protein [Eubacteriales bacterium]